MRLYLLKWPHMKSFEGWLSLTPPDISDRDIRIIGVYEVQPVRASQLGALRNHIKELNDV